jgi:RNA recognition motif-containing protein
LEEWKKERLLEKRKYPILVGLSISRHQLISQERQEGTILSDEKQPRNSNLVQVSFISRVVQHHQVQMLTKTEEAAPTAKRQKIQMPDEYLPPNNILFIQNLPEGTTQDDLREVFEVHAGLVEIRTIPAKKDIAFVEFADEGSATVAKDALHNFKIDGEVKMKVTYARK